MQMQTTNMDGKFLSVHVLLLCIFLWLCFGECVSNSMEKQQESTGRFSFVELNPAVPLGFGIQITLPLSFFLPTLSIFRRHSRGLPEVDFNLEENQKITMYQSINKQSAPKTFTCPTNVPAKYYLSLLQINTRQCRERFLCEVAADTGRFHPLSELLLPKLKYTAPYNKKKLVLCQTRYNYSCPLAADEMVDVGLLGYVSGLVNLRNTCFLNSVLQALASCSSLLAWMNLSCLSQDNTMRDGLTNTLSCLLNNLNGDSSNINVKSAVDVIRSLQTHSWFISEEEHDAHEMFHILMSTLDEETSLTSNKNYFTEMLINSVDEVTSTSAVGRNYLKLSGLGRKSNLPFMGSLASQMKCLECGHKRPGCFEKFYSLSLPIVNLRRSQSLVLTLDDCIGKFMKPERLHEVECLQCSKENSSKTTTKSTFIKQLSIGKLPRILCFHLQRIIWMDDGVPIKKEEFVKFPDKLYMDKYTYFKRGYQSKELVDSVASNHVVDTVDFDKSEPKHNSLKFLPNGENRFDFRILTSTKLQDAVSERMVSTSSAYVLKAVVVHVGTVSSGHFFTYRQLFDKEQHCNLWFRCSDENIGEVTINEVLNSNAYMIIYERSFSSN